MDKPKLLGILGGLIFFIIIILILVQINSDFDTQLINSVGAGVPAEKLIPGIEAERENEKLIAKKELEAHVMDPNYWSKPGIASVNDFNEYKSNYDITINAIYKLEELRKQYVHRKISNDEFLRQAKNYLDYIQIYITSY